MSRAAALPDRPQISEAEFAAKGAEGRKLYMKYAGPQQRTDNCRGCKFATHELLNTGSWNESQRLTCSVGEFPVAAGGVCEHWEKAK